MKRIRKVIAKWDVEIAAALWTIVFACLIALFGGKPLAAEADGPTSSATHAVRHDPLLGLAIARQGDGALVRIRAETTRLRLQIFDLLDRTPPAPLAVASR